MSFQPPLYGLVTSSQEGYIISVTSAQACHLITTRPQSLLHRLLISRRPHHSNHLSKALPPCLISNRSHHSRCLCMASQPHDIKATSFKPYQHVIAALSQGGLIIPAISAQPHYLITTRPYHSSPICTGALLLVRRQHHSSNVCIAWSPHLKDVISFQPALHGLATSSQQGHIIVASSAWLMLNELK